MKIGNIEFGPQPLFLAPMEDVTDIGFRMLCKRFGAAMVYINHGGSESLAEHAKTNICYVFHRSEEEGLRPKFYISYFHEFRVKSSYSYDVYLLFCGCKVTAFF